MTSVALDAEGRTAVSGDHGGEVRIWDTASGACLRALEGHKLAVSSVALDDKGRTAVSWGWDGTVRVWCLATSRCLVHFACDTDVQAVALSKSVPRFVAVGLHDGRVLFFETK